MCASRTFFVVRCPLNNFRNIDDSSTEDYSSANVDNRHNSSSASDDSQQCSKVQDILQKRHVRWSTWLKSSCGQFTEIHFCCNEGIESEKMIEELSSIGIGKAEGSCILVLPVSYSTKDPRQSSQKKSQLMIANQKSSDTLVSTTFSGKASRREFIKSIRARLTVPQVFATISASARITFDYVSLGILASIIAALGLCNNSSVIIVASMLISPLMGPILAMVFALTIWDINLLSLGIKSEMLGIGLCLIVGLFCGLISGAFQFTRNSTFDIPTKEMCERGQLSSLINGVFVALPSGAGVAISVLGGNIGSLVGVAISASLLPPAVNCGVLIGLALIAYFLLPRKPNGKYYESMCPVNDTMIWDMDSIWISRHLAGLGMISLLLTILNIFCILLMGILVLKIKQVTKRNTFADKFWDDLKASKTAFVGGQTRKASRMGVEYLHEWAGLYGLDVDAERDRNVTSQDVRRRVKLFAQDFSKINSDLNLITNNVYRYGPTTHVDTILEDVLPALPPKWTEIFKHENNTSSRFEVVPAESDEEVLSSHF